MHPSEREPIFLLPREAAALAGLSTRAIYRAIQRGELGAARLCSRLRIPRAAFEEWVDRSAVVPERAVPVEPPPLVPAPEGSFRLLLRASPNEDGAA